MTIGGNIHANGGEGGQRPDTLTESRWHGGSGSGGAIYLKGENLVINSGVTIQANGANGVSGVTVEGGTAAGGGGRIYIEGVSSLVNHESSDNDNVTANGGVSGGSHHGGGGTVKIIRSQDMELVFASGGLTIDTDLGTINHTDGAFLGGTISENTYLAPDGSAHPYRICTFTLDRINLGPAVVVTIKGDAALSLRTRNHGEITIATDLNGDGEDASNNKGGSGKLGGWDGGDPNSDGKGPGKGKDRTLNNFGGGGGYGGLGLSNNLDTHGQVYGEFTISELLGGSGGGGGNDRSGGAGGGAIELVAHGNGAVTIATGAQISVNGGDTTPNGNDGGGGSGGSIRLQGGSIVNNGTLEAKGMVPLANYVGGSGRIAFVTDGELKVGNIDISGSYEGNVAVIGETPGLPADLNYTSGILTFNTTAGIWHHSSGQHGRGVITTHNDGGNTYGISTYTFDSINLHQGLTVAFEGSNSLILKTRNNGDIAVGTDLNANGSNSPGGTAGGSGKLGGYDGGWNQNDAKGPGKGKTNNDGGGGGYGSAGVMSGGGYGEIYGDLILNHLHGGSGGGGGSSYGAGAGGGALSLEADGNGTVTINSGVLISANGGITTNADNGGGGGSGGSLRFAGRSIYNNGSIEAKGGNFGTGSYAGGGGRVAFNSSHYLTPGTIDVGGGTIAENTIPIIVGELTATTYYNITENHFWDPGDLTSDSLEVWFDASDITTITGSSPMTAWSDKSGNGHTATRTAGTLTLVGNALNGMPVVNFADNTYANVTGNMYSKQQYIVFNLPNVGDWGSVLGSQQRSGYTFNRSGYMWNNNYPAAVRQNGGAELSGNFQLSNIGNYMVVRITGNNNNTSVRSGWALGRQEGWGRLPMNLAEVVAVDTILSTADEYKMEGYLAHKWGLNGDLPASHPYKSTKPSLGLSSTVYTINAQRGPKSYAADGLPSGLAVNPTTGLISGATTTLGIYDVTITASNLSGTSVPQTLVLTVLPNLPPLSDLNVSSVGATSARIDFNLLDTGGENPELHLLYGTTDGNQTSVAWDSNVTLGAQSSGHQSVLLTGLNPNTQYYVIARAANSAGTTLSANIPIFIPSNAVVLPPVVITTPPSSIGVTGATAEGNLLSYDGVGKPTLTLYYGAVDQGATDSGWDATVPLGLKNTGPFTHNLTGLTPGTHYYYRFKAVNDSGTDPIKLYAGTSVSFQLKTNHTATSYQATGLPPGLSIDSVIGLISGVPTTTGDFSSDVTVNTSGSAFPRTFRFRILKGARSIVWNQALTGITYGTLPIDLTATTIGGAVSYTSGDASIIEISGTMATVKKAGTVTITANALDTGDMNATDPVIKTVTIAKTPLTIAMDDQIRSTGAANPTLTYVVTGFVNGDDESTAFTISVTPSTTVADASNVVGTFPITATASSDKYSITFIDGSLLVSDKTLQTITWSQSLSGLTINQSVDLTATASSGLPVLYSIADPSVAKQVITQDPSLGAWWKLDETAGATATDSGDNGHSGTLENGATSTYGRFANGLTLDGIDDHVLFAGYKGITGFDSRTVSLWFKTSASSGPLLSYGTAGPATLFNLSLSSGTAKIALGGDNNVTGGSGLSDGNWHHLAVTSKSWVTAADTARLYVDGAPVASGSGFAAINTSAANDVKLGSDGSTYFNGQLDDVRFYVIDVSAGDITAIYNSGMGDFNHIQVLQSSATTNITASQQGDGSFAPAPNLSTQLTVGTLNQTIAFGTLPSKLTTASDFDAGASASSGLPITYTSSDTAVASIVGTPGSQTINVISAGTTTIRANQAGDATYAAATEISQSLTVNTYDPFPYDPATASIDLWFDEHSYSPNAEDFLTIDVPVVVDGPVTNISETSATLHTKVTDIGGMTYVTGSSFEANTYPGLKLWLKADAGADGGTWTDHSGNNNHATKNGAPTLVTSAQNGLPVMRYDGTAKYHSWSPITDIRTVFWVCKKSGGFFHMLGGSGGTYHFHGNGAANFFDGYAHDNVENGALWVNGTTSNKNSPIPTTMSVVSLRTLGNVRADNISNDRDGCCGGRYWNGDVAELLIYNTALTDSEIRDIEGKLAWKWGLEGDLVAGHIHESVNPNLQTIIYGGDPVDVSFYWGDDNGTANGNVWDSNGTLSGTHGLGIVSYDVDGLTKGTTYYYTAMVSNSGGEAWAPARTFVTANRLFTKDTMEGLALWLDASDVDGDGNGDSITDGTALATWNDKSNSNKEVKQTVTGNRPVYKSNQFDGKPGIRLDGMGDHFFVNGALKATPGSVSAYVVSKRDNQGGDSGAYLLDETGWNLSAGSGDAPYPTTLKKFSAGSETLMVLKIGKARLNSNYDFAGDIAEILIFDRGLSTEDEEKLEGYLAHKW